MQALILEQQDGKTSHPCNISKRVNCRQVM